MTFHVDFWVAAAAAAPVIALSATVAVSDNMKLGLRVRRLARRAPTAWELARKYENGAVIVSSINILAQCGTLFVSLKALADDNDPISPAIVIYGELLGLLAIFCAILLNGRAQRVAREGFIREEQAATRQQDADHEDELYWLSGRERFRSVGEQPLIAHMVGAHLVTLRRTGREESAQSGHW